MGLRMMPLSYFLTASTSRAWRSVLMFLWMMPMPPSRAMAMASRASVTVSMAAETSGIFSCDLPGQFGVEADLVGQHPGMGGDEQDVVEGQGFLDQTHGSGTPVGAKNNLRV